MTLKNIAEVNKGPIKMACLFSKTSSETVLILNLLKKNFTKMTGFTVVGVIDSLLICCSVLFVSFA